MLSGAQTAELRYISQQLGFRNMLSIVQILNANKVLDEGELRKECEKALLIMAWFKKEIGEVIRGQS